MKNRYLRRMIPSTIRRKLMKTYAVIIISISLIFFVGLMVLHFNAKQNDIKNNLNIAEFIKDSFDDQWQRIFNYSFQTINYSGLSELEKKEILSAEDIRESYNISTYISNNILSNSMLEELCIYLPMSNYIIGSNGIYPSHVYWASLHGISQDYPYESWMQDLFESRTNGYFSVVNNNTTDIYFRMAIPSTNGRILVGKIRRAELNKVLERIGYQNDCFIAMIDSNGTCCAYYGDYDAYINSHTNRIEIRNPNECIYTKLDSSLGFMSYIIIKNQSIVYKLSNYILIIAVILLLASILFGLSMAFVFTGRYSRPIEEILDRLSDDRTGIDEHLDKDELETIQYKIEDILLKNRIAIERLEKQQELTVSGSFLQEGLKIPFPDNSMETLSAIYGISFENDMYQILVRERAGTDNSSHIVEYLINSEQDDLWIGWTQKQDIDVFLLNYSQSSTCKADAFIDDLTGMSDPNSRIVSGDRTDNIEAVRREYIGCLKKLGRRCIFDSRTGGEFNILSGKMVSYSEFLNHLRNGEYTEIEKSEIHELCRSYIMDRNDLIHICTRYEIVKCAADNLDKSKWSLLYSFVREESVDKLENILTDIVRECARRKSTSKSIEEESDLAGKIRCIIDESYFNPMLDIRMISENLGYSQSHTTRVFKQKYSMGIPQYVNHIRIIKAKELLEDENETIKSIALQVGFASDIQFIRVFKKAMDITPGQYRKNFEDKK